MGVGQEGPGLDQLAPQPLDPVLVRAPPARLEQGVAFGDQFGQGGLSGTAGADDPGGEDAVADLLVRQGPQLGQLVDVDGEDALVQVLGGAAEQIGQLAVLDRAVRAGDAQRRAPRAAVDGELTAVRIREEQATAVRPAPQGCVVVGAVAGGEAEEHADEEVLQGGLARPRWGRR